MSTIKVNEIKDYAGTTTLAKLDTGVLSGVLSPMGMRNRIINGAMVIDQRNGGAATTPSTNGPVYLLDRFFLYNSQVSKLTYQQNAGSVTPPVGFSKYFGITVASAATVGAADVFIISQAIEGQNIADLDWGTANAAPVTLSFWVRSSLTGNFSGALQNSGNSRTYAFSYAIDQANTWERKTIVVAGDTTGTWLTNNSTGISLVFSLGAGSTFSTTSGSWVAGNTPNVTGSVNLVATNGATFYITGVQLEKGSVATPFEFRSIGQELALAQRYYEFGSVFQVFSGNVTSGEIYYNPVRFSVSKRAAPTVVAGATNGVTLFVVRFPTTALTSAQINPDGYYTQATANGTGTGYFQYSWTASAEL